MSRIEAAFDACKAQGRTALVPYITAGDSEPGMTLPLMHALVDAGADVIELGVPFSDPMADGPVIQQACERALEHGTGLPDVLAMVKQFRETNQNTPVVLMGYTNPVEIMGVEKFAKAAVEAGVDGVLTVDSPPEEAQELSETLKAHDLCPIYLLAPTSDDTRIDHVAEQAKGFVYYVALKGVTGAATLDVSSVAEKMAQIKKHVDMPVGVGFGIKDAASAQQVAEVADAVVVGSAIVRLVGENAGNTDAAVAAVSALVKDIRQALDQQVSAA